MKASVQNVSPAALGRAIRLVALTLLAAVLGSMFGAGAAHAQLKAYVANAGDNSLSVIDAATNTVVGTIPVAGTPAHLVISPDNSRAYVSATDANNVAVVDLATNTVIANVPVGINPSNMTQSRNGAFVYVANASSSTVSVIATATNTVATTLPTAGSPTAIATTPDGASVWVANVFGVISVIDTATNTITAPTFSTGGSDPFGIVFTPDGAFAYLADDRNRQAIVIDTVTKAIVATIPTPGADPTTPADPTANAITPDGTTVYQIDNGGTVTIIDTATNTVVATLSLGNSFLFGVAFTPDGAFAYVTAASDNSVFVISTATRSVAATVPVGVFPIGIALTTVPTPQAQIAALIAQVKALVTAGKLAQSNANPLLNTLENAAKHLDKGQVKQTCKELGDFINKVNGDIQTGKLTAADGQALINAANAIRANLGC